MVLFEMILEDAKKLLCPDYESFTKVYALVKPYNLKARYGWFYKSFSELLRLLSEMLPPIYV